MCVCVYVHVPYKCVSLRGAQKDRSFSPSFPAFQMSLSAVHVPGPRLGRGLLVSA